MASDEEAIVLLPELGSSTSLFSDEVSVAVRKDGARVLVPASNPQGQGVPFTIVPVTEVNKL